MQDDVSPPDWDADPEWTAPPRDADGTRPHAAVPFSGLFDDEGAPLRSAPRSAKPRGAPPEIAAPVTWL